MKASAKILRPIALICIFCLIISAFSGCKEKTTAIEFQAFGKDGTAVFYTENPDEAAPFVTLITEALAAAQKDFSRTEEDSQLKILNETGMNYVSDTLKKALEDSVIICSALGDLVDISMGKALSLWGFYSDSPAVPDSEELKSAMESQTLDKLVIARDSNKVTITDDMEIDMSPLAAGIALDEALNAAKFCKTPYLITLGDMTLAYGRAPGGEWKLSVRDPFSEEKKDFATIKVPFVSETGSVFVSASGVWENSFTQDGKTYHSFLDPETGYPCDNSLVSVTVVTESGITADALSDALLVNGFSEKSLDYIESFFAEAIFVFADKTYYVTEGLRDGFELRDSSFTEHTEAPATELF